MTIEKYSRPPSKFELTSNAVIDLNIDKFEDPDEEDEEGAKDGVDLDLVLVFP